MGQFSLNDTATAEICAGSTVVEPRRLAARPNFQGYAYLMLTQVLITAVCGPGFWETQSELGMAPPVAG